MASLSAALAGSLVFAPAATANVHDDDNLYSIEGCRVPGSAQFKFSLWYNSGQNGTYRNVGYSVYNFDALVPGGSDPGAYPMKFCILRDGGKTPGSGQRVKNNAAAGENFHYKYTARVYYKSGYKGVYDAMAPYQHIDRFPNVYNENASFKWV
ncbi:hypothetical protein ABZ705_34420 [Streptomyces sp. NPDC006984]|uniref:hypothetical protein n=1 Tax=Streptomyces sp. NPDC006984 TaxID=3155463 RepID=UPI0033D105F6